MKILNIQQAKTHLSRLVEEAIAGQEIVVAKAGKPMVRLTPYVTRRSRRKPGGWQGKVWLSDDFDETPEEVLVAFEGRFK